MAKVYSRKYPGLWVPALGVRFRDGVAEVSDPDTLRALDKFEGVEVPEPPKSEPKRSAKKSDRKSDDD